MPAIPRRVQELKYLIGKDTYFSAGELAEVLSLSPPRLEVLPLYEVLEARLNANPLQIGTPGHQIIEVSNVYRNIRGKLIVKGNASQYNIETGRKEVLGGVELVLGEKVKDKNRVPATISAAAQSSAKCMPGDFQSPTPGDSTSEED